jgi:hypothetical protein
LVTNMTSRENDYNLILNDRFDSNDQLSAGFSD